MKMTDRILETVVAAAIVVLVATLGMAAFGCSGTVDFGVEVAAGRVVIDGKTHTVLRDVEHGRQIIETQRAPGKSSVALEVAKRTRAYVFHPVEGMLLGPEHDVDEIARRLPADFDLRRGENVRVKRRGAPRQIVFGTDDRYFARADIQLVPTGSLAALAFDHTRSPFDAVPGDEATVTSWGAGSGHMVQGRTNFGDGSGMMGASVGHIWFHHGEPAIFRMQRGWVLPHNRLSSYNGTSPFICKPIVSIPAGWMINGDYRYDLAILNWASQWCGDNHKHDYKVPWVNIDSQPHTGTPAILASVNFNFLNWGHPEYCGWAGTIWDPRTSANTPKWPSSCGMQAGGWHQVGMPWLQSGNLDTSDGTSGSGWFTNTLTSGSQWGTKLLGVTIGETDCPAPCNQHAIATPRRNELESFITGAGVQ